MKIWITVLPLVCAASLSMAQTSVTPDGTPPPAASAPSPAASSIAAERAVANPGDAAAPVKPRATAGAKRRAGKVSARTLPKGDVRHCLDLKTRTAVIRCSETRRGK